MAMAEALDIPKSKLGTCTDSRASKDYCPDHMKFSNYKTMQRNITTADRRTLTAVGMGDLYLDLPNGSKKTSIIFKNAIHALEMAFTLISISCLDKAGFPVMFNKGMCTVKNAKANTIATIPHSNRLYKIISNPNVNARQTANAVSEKMSITKAHKKLGHIAHSAI